MFTNPTYEDLTRQVSDLERQVRWLEHPGTQRMAQTSQLMLRISMALPEYPELEDLLDYITREIKRLLNTHGALVILVDQEKNEFFFPGAAYEDLEIQKRIKDLRLPIDSLASAEVVKTGKALIINDAYKDSARYSKRDREFGYSFDNYVLVPIKIYDRIIGVLAAFNKFEGRFETPDMKLLETIAGTVGLSIENARFADELKQSHRELQSLDLAKNRAINHLSHELKTPVSIFSGTLQILEKKLEQLPDDSWKRSMSRARRSVDRIKYLQNEIHDIILDKNSGVPPLLTCIVDQCADLFAHCIEAEQGHGPDQAALLCKVKQRIAEIFKTENTVQEAVFLHEFVGQRLEAIIPRFSHRSLDIDHCLDACPPVMIAPAILKKIVDGIIKNAVENTPDGGRIKVRVTACSQAPCFRVRDFGIGIHEDNLKRIFKGFYATQETASYCSKQPFEFNAGGRGADLLRMKIFSRQYNFSIRADSKRCRFIPAETDICPGVIKQCTACKSQADCLDSGGSTFTVKFNTQPA